MVWEFPCRDNPQYNFDGVKNWTRPKRLKTGGQASECVLDVDRIMVPINRPMHWVSAVIDLKQQCVIYLDSLGVRLLCQGLTRTSYCNHPLQI